MKELGVYIHIPFCMRKCDYCDFISYSGKEDYIEEYIESVKNEIKNELDIILNCNKEYQITTIYIGGGTPSFIDSKYIMEILNEIKKLVVEGTPLGDPTEITIEINPGTATIQKLEDYKKAGINRLSIGLQETNNEILKSIGRIHTYEQFLNTYNLARKVGFKNINVDLMIGLPNQSIENIKSSLIKVLNLNPEHISVYSLILEEGTKLYNKYENGEIDLPDEEQERNMYWYVKNTLENEGYVHYEISNFAKQGYESKHNVNCWEQKEYIGFGLAAHSYFNRTRYSNIANIKEYIEDKNTTNKCRKKLGVGVAPKGEPTKYIIENKIVHEKQSEEAERKEYMLLGLRKIGGISIQKFKNKFGDNPVFLFKEELNKLVERKLIVIDGDRIRLTNKGLDLANIVWEKFV